MKLRLVALVAAASCAVACVVESDPPPPPPGPGYVSGTPSGQPSGGSSGGSGTTPTPSSTAPILVDVDTDKTMNAAPGEGVGVFVEYASGGHWHVWWTCDTNVNPQGALTCDFDVKANVTQGSLKLTKADTPDGGAHSTTTQDVEATTITGSQVHGLWFDTDPGATITVTATIGGQLDGRYFFFVQNGQVNGGYAGTLTDPLMFEGNRP